jgi:hypothetical protein
MFGAAQLAATPETLTEAFAVTGSVGALGAHGVALRVEGSPTAYFWTSQREAVLTALAAAGFRVSWDESSFEANEDSMTAAWN